MSGPVNPHKQGEHVFNDIAGAVRNAFEAALRLDRAGSLMLTGPYGPVRLFDLPAASAAIGAIAADPVIAQARTVVAPATGVESDFNSASFGQARLHLEQVLSEVVLSTAVFLWRKKPGSAGSFHDFERIVAGLHDKSFAVACAKTAFSALIEAAHDPEAEESALGGGLNEMEASRRREIIANMRQHSAALKTAGASLIETFANELEYELERRIGAA